MRISDLVVAGALLGAALPATAQVADTAAAVERLRREVQSGRRSPEEIRARIRAAGISAEEIRRRLREAGYPANLLDPYLTEGAALTGAPSLAAAQLERVLRRLSIPALGELELPDSLVPGQDSLVVDTAGVISRPAPGLQIFGKSLFERATTQFRPVTMGPVPSN